MKRLIGLLAMVSLLAVPAFADDCVDISFEAEPELQVGVVYFIYGEITNCSDEAGLIFFNISLDAGYMTYTFPEFSVFMAAGQTFAKSFPFVIPPVVPEGDVTITITATKGEASDTEIIYLTVTHPGGDDDGDESPRNDKGRSNPNRLEHAPQSITIN